MKYLERLAIGISGGFFALFTLLLAGLRLLFVQRGELGFRLVHLDYSACNQSTNTNAKT